MMHRLLVPLLAVLAACDGTLADATYHGEPLNGSMCTLAQNALQYYLSQSESANDESY